MNIILSNYRYFLSGGPERYLFNIKKIFEKNGHNIIPFSVKSVNNEGNLYDKFFMSSIGDGTGTYFEEYKRDPLTVAKLLSRQIYSIEGFYKARRIAKNTNAHILYCLHFLNKMSPSILDGFRSVGIPIVVRISDFGLICPQAHFYNSGRVCEKCIKGDFHNCIRYRCVKNSKIGSLIKAVAYNFHRAIGVFEKVNAIVFPSSFTMQKYIDAGFNKKKLYHVPTFIDFENFRTNFSSQKYLLYFGRITEEKGVHNLIEAYIKMKQEKIRLIIIGDRNDSEYSRALVKIYGHKVQFLGFMRKSELCRYIEKAITVVVPSVWYDNQPNVVLESFATGKPVIAPNHGSFPELISHQDTGILYESGNIESLKDSLEFAISNLEKMRQMGINARDYVQSEHRPMKHYTKLLHLFSRIRA
jgi:glycosyltransferase involved in cell wall biosynthesis